MARSADENCDESAVSNVVRISGVTVCSRTGKQYSSSVKREAVAQPGAHRVLGCQHLDGVVDIEAIARVGIVDAVQRRWGVVEAATDQLGVLVPCGPAGDRVVQEHQTHTVSAQLIDHISLVVGRLDLLERRIGAGEPQAGHVVEDDHVVAGLGSRRRRPSHVGHRIEHGEERLGLERMATGDDQHVDRRIELATCQPRPTKDHSPMIACSWESLTSSTARPATCRS